MLYCTVIAGDIDKKFRGMAYSKGLKLELNLGRSCKDLSLIHWARALSIVF